MLGSRYSGFGYEVGEGEIECRLRKRRRSCSVGDIVLFVWSLVSNNLVDTSNTVSVAATDLFKAVKQYICNINVHSYPTHPLPLRREHMQINSVHRVQIFSLDFK